MSSTLSNSRNLSTLEASEPSIYINYVFENITRERIIETFTEVFAGDYVERLDMVRKTNTDTEEEYFSVFVHLKTWPTGQAFQNIRQKLIDGKDFKLVYDSPWFWKCCASKMPKPSNKPKVRLSPFISCDDDEDKPVARKVAVKSKLARRADVIAEEKTDETKTMTKTMTKTKTKTIKTKKTKDNAEDNVEVVAPVVAPVVAAKKTKTNRKDGAGAGAVATADAKHIATKTKTTKKVVVLQNSVRPISSDDEVPKYAVRTAVVDAASVSSDTYLLAYNSIGAPRVDSIEESNAGSSAESSKSNDSESNDSESNDDESS